VGTIHKQLALTEVTAGMVLSDHLLDPQGQILLPKDTALTERIIESLHRHAVVSLPILMGELTAEEEAAQRAHYEVRLARLFRKSDNSEANGLLHRYLCNFRLGVER
jgi:hypothetical protein